MAAVLSGRAESPGARSTVVGPITYVHASTRAFDTARAARAVRFLDSLASALDVGRVGLLTYVMAGDAAALSRLLGYTQAPAAARGRAFGRNRLIVSGALEHGDAHLHELAHFVIDRLVDPSSESRFFVEEAASWTGGRADGSLPTTLALLRQHLERRPALALRDVLDGQLPRMHTAFCPLATVLCQMAFERGGMARSSGCSGPPRRTTVRCGPWRASSACGPRIWMMRGAPMCSPARRSRPGSDPGRARIVLEFAGVEEAY